MKSRRRSRPKHLTFTLEKSHWWRRNIVMMHMGNKRHVPLLGTCSKRYATMMVKWYTSIVSNKKRRTVEFGALISRRSI